MESKTNARLARLEKDTKPPEPPKAWKIIIKENEAGGRSVQHFLDGKPIDEGQYRPGQNDKIKVKLVED